MMGRLSRFPQNATVGLRATVAVGVEEDAGIDPSIDGVRAERTLVSFGLDAKAIVSNDLGERDVGGCNVTE